MAIEKQYTFVLYPGLRSQQIDPRLEKYIECHWGAFVDLAHMEFSDDDVELTSAFENGDCLPSKKILRFSVASNVLTDEAIKNKFSHILDRVHAMGNQGDAYFGLA